MAFETDYAPYDYSPGSAMAAEAIPFPFLDAGHLVVTHIADATGAATVLVPDADYVIAGNGSVGAGTIAATAEWPVADLFRIERRTPAVQKAVLPPGQPIPSRAVEGQLDRQAMVQQEAGEQLGRAIVVPVGDTPLVLEAVGEGQVPARVGNKLVGVPNGAAEFVVEVVEAKAEIAAQVSGATTTLNGLVTTAGGHASAAAGSAGAAAGSAGAAAGSAGAAAGHASDADTARAETEAALAAALALLVGNKIYTATTLNAAKTAGLAGVAEGETFAAKGDDVDYIAVFKDVAGVAVEQFRLATSDQLADAVASVPVGSALWTFTGEAPDNLGETGDRGYSTDLKLNYPTRTGTGWAAAIDAEGNLRAKDSVIWDMARGDYPTGSLSTTRAHASTTLINADPSGTAPVSVSAGEPVVHPTKGLLCYQYAKKLLATSNPSDGPVSMPVTGRLVIWMSGPGQVTTSAGTATGTGWGTLVSAPNAYQLLNITGTGTVNLDFSGTTADTYVQVEYNDVVATAVPTPYMGAVSTRNGDQTVVGGALLTTLQGSAGTLLIDVERPHRTTGNGNTVLSLNGAAVLFLSDDDTATYYDGVHIQSFDVGDANFATGPVRLALTWEGGRVSVGAGSRIPVTLPYSLMNGTARSSARLGIAGNSDIYGQQALNGAISRIEFKPAALTEFELFERYNVTKPFPSNDALLVNYSAARSFRTFRDAVLKMLASTLMPSGHWPVVAFGPGTSHTAGTNGTTGQVKQVSTPARWAARAAAEGIPARVTSWVGNAGFPGGGGTNTYDNRLSCSTGWSGWGTQLAGSAMRATTASRTIDFAEPTETDSYRIYFWTGNASAFGGEYGRFTISVNGGAAIKTVNCSGVAGMSYADVGPADGVTHGVNTYRITTLDAKPVGIAGAIAWSSVNPHLIVVNGGTPLRTMVTMATDTISAFTPENSVPEMLRKLAASLIVVEGVTNDAAGLVGDSTYRTAIGSVLDAAIATGADVWPWTNPPTATATIAQDVQDRYTRIFLAECAKRNLTVADYHFAMGPHAPYAIAKMGIFHDLVHLTGTGTVPGYEIQARRAAEVTGARLLAS